MTASLEATRLWLSAGLDAADRDALTHACGEPQQVKAGTDLLRQEARPSGLHIVLDGWAARYKIMEDGSRAISALIAPGDLCDVDALRFDRLGYGVTMLSAGSVVMMPRERADALFAAHPAIANAFWSLALVDKSIVTERAASLGRQPALPRVAHLLCELWLRLTVVGKVDANSYELPLTQEHIADAVGLTPVHINRMLQTLRVMGLVTVQNRRVTIHDWRSLTAMCAFRPDYLHFETVAEQFATALPASGARARAKLTWTRDQDASSPKSMMPNSSVPLSSSEPTASETGPC